MPTPSSDLELMNRLIAQDVAALAELYDRYGGLAYSLALRILGDPGRAEDIVQECFLKLWNAAGKFDASRGSLKAWLTTTVRNRSIDHLRGKAGKQRQELELLPDSMANSSSQDPWLEVAAALERDLLLKAMESLSKEQRQVIELAYFGGYNSSEIANLLKVPATTIKGRIRLALTKLHSYLKGKSLEPSN